MIESMTAFGLSILKKDSFQLKVEIKSLNSKIFDFTITKIPPNFSSLEFDIRKEVAEKVKRGKITLNIEIETDGKNTDKDELNEPLFVAHYNKLKKLAEKIDPDNTELFKIALNHPNIFSQNEDTENLFSCDDVQTKINESVSILIENRRNEGVFLYERLLQYIEKIQSCLQNILDLLPKRRELAIERISKSLAGIKEKVTIDENRFEQEIVYYLEKIDCAEECDRLSYHLQYFIQILDSPQSQGKKLGFICQEMGREINTLGAKAYMVEIQKIVIDMKEYLEKIKEQLANIL